MRELIVQTVQGRGRIGLTLGLTVALGLTLMILITPGALSEDPTPEATAVPEEPPLGDCYGGVLSHAPLHCYALEQAEYEGVIHIEGIYMTRPGEFPWQLLPPPESLYIYVTESQDSVRGLIYEYLYGRMKEYAENWPELVAYGRFYSESCALEERPAACVSRYIEGLPESAYYRNSLFMDYGGYAVTEVRGGGIDARIEKGGWASWKQVWPIEGHDEQDEARNDPASATYDVSDVDRNNIPEVDCGDIFVVSSISELSCAIWQRFPEFHFAGNHPSLQWSNYSDATNHYFQMKIPPAKAKEWESIILERNPGFSEEGDDVVVLPVKHDFGDLWRYAVILQRFSVSTGNTIGIMDARVGVNIRAFQGEAKTINASDEMELVEYYDSPPIDDWAKFRETVLLTAHHAEVVLEALPVLLPLLDIPVDAVGVIYQPVPWPDRQIYAAGSSNNLLFDESLGDWGLGKPLAEEVSISREVVVEAENLRGNALATFTEMDDENRDSVDNVEDHSVLEGNSEQNGVDRSRNSSKVAQPDPMDTKGLHVPAMEIATPENNGDSGLFPWVPTLIVVGVVAMALVAAGLAKIRLSYRTL